MPANLLIGLSGWFPSSKPGRGLLDNVDPSKPEQFTLLLISPPSQHPSKEILDAFYGEDSPISFPRGTKGKWHAKIRGF